MSSSLSRGAGGPPGPPPASPTLLAKISTAPTRLATSLAHPPPASQTAVIDAISPARFATYLRYAGGVESRAWAAYAWNVRVSAAMLQLLVHAEVALRNAVSRALTGAFGANWPYAPAFEFTFSAVAAREYRDARAELEQRLKRSPLSTGDFVAGQTFVFWEGKLVRRYRERVWDKQFRRAFAGAAAGESYKDVHDEAEKVRKLRNRIAHHEPLLTVNLVDEYVRALTLISWTSQAKAAWVASEWPMTDQFAGPP